MSDGLSSTSNNSTDVGRTRRLSESLDNEPIIDELTALLQSVHSRQTMGDQSTSDASDVDGEIISLDSKDAIHTLLMHSNLNGLLKRYELKQDHLKSYVDGNLIRWVNVPIPLKQDYKLSKFKQARLEIQKTIVAKMKATKGVKDLLAVAIDSENLSLKLSDAIVSSIELQYSKQSSSERSKPECIIY